MIKKLLVLLMFYFSISEINSQVLLSEGFESSFVPTGWTRINNSTTGGRDWLASDDATVTDGPYTAYAGNKFMIYEYTSASAANAWMITPAIALTSGSTYKITFWYRVRSASFPEKLKVTIGSSATVAAQTTALWTNNGGASLSNTSYVQATINYTATATGNSYFGFNCFSAADQWALQVDDIAIEKINLCSGTPTAGNASAATPYLCASGTSVLSLVGATSSTGVTYQWQSAPTGTTSWANISGATTVPYTATVSASTDYRCILTCSNGGATSTSGITTVTLGAVPSNDLVCNANTLVLNAATQCGNTTCATATGDPVFSNSTANNTVWFTYTPTTTGIVNFIMTRPSGATTGLLYGWLGVYTATGTCPTLALTETTSNLPFDLTANTTVTLVSPSLTAGTTYYFMIDGFSGASGAFCIQMITPPTPPNCTTTTAPTNNATNVAAPIATLTWNAAATATSYDIYFGTTNPPTTLAGTISATTTPISGLSFSTQYYWYVVPKNNGGTATGCVSNISTFTTQAAPLPPANDECTNAIVISSYLGNVSGTTISATASASIPACADATGQDDDVWYKFTASQNGNASVVVTGGTGFDAVVGVYSGSCGALTLVGTCVDNTSSAGIETVSLTSLVAGQTYYVRVYSYSTTTGGTFTIALSGAAVPVSIVNFKGERKGTENVFTWTTLSELNNNGFELQRSADGINFSSLIFTASKSVNGNSNQPLAYSIADTKPFSGSGYYRLKQIDKDGKASMSDIILIKGTKSTKLELVGVYPNPVVNNINVVLNAPKAGKITLVIADMTGKIIVSKSIIVNNGDNNLQLNVADLSKGTYTIKAICIDGCETAFSKFVKQ